MLASIQYAVFVSYAEVYNEYMYDLLEPPPAKTGRRVALKLAQDASSDVYIKGTFRACRTWSRVMLSTGLREVRASNITEAFKLLIVGQRNRRVAETVSNQESSRRYLIAVAKHVFHDDDSSIVTAFLQSRLSVSRPI